MAEETKPNDPMVTTPVVVPPTDNDGSKADAHWQKIADERFIENEKLKKELDEAKKAKEETNELTELKNRLQLIETEKEKQNLETLYPDIEPDLLVGKTSDEQKNIAERQRKRTEEHRQNSIDVNVPEYSQNEIDDQIGTVKKSTKNPIQQAQEVLRLERLRKT